jgi:hypothetical protein
MGTRLLGNLSTMTPGKALQTPPQTYAARQEPVRVTAGLLVFLLFVIVAITVVHMSEEQHYDFGVFYYAARMVWDGERTSLYDLDAQRATQIRYKRPPEFLFYNPPFVLVPLLPLAALPIRWAFVGWTAASIGMLVAAVRYLARRSNLNYGNWPILMSLVFMPVASGLGHGQFSFVVFAGYAASLALWSKERRFAGGVALSFGLFKPQLVAGFLCVLLLRRKWRELLGFAAGGMFAGLVSVALVGPSAMMRYPRFLAECEAGVGVDPLKMANLRGLMTLLGLGGYPVLLAALSLAAIVLAARMWRCGRSARGPARGPAADQGVCPTGLDAGFSAATLATMLVSYHFNPQDLVLILIPILLWAPRWKVATLRAATAAGAALPIVLSILPNGLFVLLSIPVLAAIFWPCVRAKSAATALYTAGHSR